MKKHIALLLFVALSYQALAARIEYGSNVTISTPVYEDLYIAGGTIIINAPVYADLIVAGGTIHINDSVSNDILVAGGNVTFNGYVGDDIRCAGGSLLLLKNVAGDVVITGGNLSVSNNATIGSLVASGGDIHIDGTILHELRGMFGRLVLNGTVMNTATCRGNYITINGVIHGASVLSAAEKLTIGDTAKFLGSVHYWSPQRKVDFKQSATSTVPVKDASLKIGTERWYFLGFTNLFAVLWYLSMAIVMIFIVEYFFGGMIHKAGITIASGFLKSLGYGLLFFIAVPVIAVIIGITIIGLPLGVITLMGYLVLLMLATVISATVLSNWIHHQTKSQPGLWRLTFSAFLIFILLKIISLTPFFGWLIMCCIAAASFGAIIRNIKWQRLNRHHTFKPAM